MDKDGVTEGFCWSRWRWDVDRRETYASSYDLIVQEVSEIPSRGLLVSETGSGWMQHVGPGP
jgi:hypothetical protein